MTGTANVPETGVAGTGSVGTLATTGAAIQGVTGQAGTIAQGDETVTGDCNQALTTVVGTGAVSSVTTITENTVELVGDIPATGVVNGTFGFNLDCNITLTGQVGTGEITLLTVWGIIDDSQDPNWTEIAA